MFTRGQPNIKLFDVIFILYFYANPVLHPNRALNMNCFELYDTKSIRSDITEKFKTLENVKVMIYITVFIFSV